MKKTHIAALIMMVVAIGMLVISSKNLSSYATFETAAKSQNRVTVVGQLSMEDPVVYQPEKDPNYFSFWLVDQAGNKNKVVLSEPKPTDFERSEEIVVTGKMDSEVFMASDMLLKCPSKYAEEKLDLRKQS